MRQREQNTAEFIRMPLKHLYAQETPPDTIMTEDAKTSAAGDPVLAERIRRYWDGRAEGFAATRAFELTSAKRLLWLEELEGPLLAAARIVPTGSPVDILDIGTGAGYFSLLLNELGRRHGLTLRILGIDLSPEMVKLAQQNAEQAGADNLAFQVMDAQALTLPDNRFALIVTRNLTWTLPDAEAAYREWHRVLMPGAVLVNFDADYGAVSFASLTRDLRCAGEPNAHKDVADETLAECDAIKAKLPVSRRRRPQWDAQHLLSLGFESIETDTTISDRLYAESDEAWNPVPMFRLLAVKGR